MVTQCSAFVFVVPMALPAPINCQLVSSRTFTPLLSYVCLLSQMDKTRVAMFSPPQLRAVHWGHAGPVLDVSWCGDAERPWALASASSAQEDSEGHEMQGGVVQVWAPGRYLIS